MITLIQGFVVYTEVWCNLHKHFFIITKNAWYIFNRPHGDKKSYI